MTQTVQTWAASKIMGASTGITNPRRLSPDCSFVVKRDSWLPASYDESLELSSFLKRHWKNELGKEIIVDGRMRLGYYLWDIGENYDVVSSRFTADIYQSQVRFGAWTRVCAA
ncbi:hypothetical protein HYFRA_00013691 [Hymenoscyphus fraxineus]|uniref:Uncharacterized protein n=1 Tax=Hymenoscyphus fraxineus TaxID=746836 RepID=A0A9N9LBA5_9HELO|nr:hypothetical protein HYFRA_00013691 [Hymenoscyphus fraxineus]